MAFTCIQCEACSHSRIHRFRSAHRLHAVTLNYTLEGGGDDCSKTEFDVKIKVKKTSYLF